MLSIDGITKEDFQAYLVYCSGIFANMGNYKGFGDFKIVPDLTPEKFLQIVQASKAYKDDKERVMSIWNSIKDIMFLLNKETKQLGLGKNGITKYWTANCNEVIFKFITSFLNSCAYSKVQIF